MNALKKLVTWEAGLVAGILLGVAILGTLGAKLGWWVKLSEATGGWFWVLLFLALVLGILVAVLWLLPRYREKRFLDQMRTEDAQSPQDELQESYRQLQDKLLEAIRTLGNSPDLKKQGGLPLYALPWYVLMGASQSGKTTLLRSVAQHFTPFVQPTASVGKPTQDCDWWLFNTALILDTTSRYAFPAQVERDSAEWYRFLQLLRYYRELQPINGMIIAVAVDVLASQDAEALRREAAELRKRLDEAVRELGVDFPVYLLVTRCDLLEGFSEFCGCLPEPILQQVFGHVYESRPQVGNQPAAASGERFEATYAAVVERLRQLRLVIYNEEKLPAAALRQRIFCFPEEFGALQQPLSTFVGTLFAENPYQYTPFLRGLFFSSAQQQGSAVSFLRRQFRFDGQSRPVEGEPRTYFLHDLFAVILPRDRYLVRPTGTARRGRFFRHFFGFVGSLVLCLLLAGGLIQAFWSDRQIYTAVDAASCLATREQPQGEPRLEQAERCRQVVHRLSERNQQRLALSKVVFNRSGTLEQRLRQRYVETFPAEVLEPLDARAEQRLTASAEAIPLIFSFIKRIALLNRCLSGLGCPEPIDQDVQPDYQLMLDPARQRSPTPEEVATLQQTYEAYLQWARGFPEALHQEQTAHTDRLRRWFASQQFSPRQLLPWANKSYKSVMLEEYWEGFSPTSGRNTIQVEGAYTRRAWEQGFLPFLQRARDAVPDMQPLLEEFQTAYRAQYFEQWQHFWAEFPRGEPAGRNTSAQRRQLVVKLLDERSPYNRLLDVTFDNLKPFVPAVLLSPPPDTKDTTIKAAEATLPAWVRVFRRYLSSDSRKAYLAALRRIGEPLGSDAPREKSFQLAQVGFQERIPTEKSTHPVLQAMWIINQLRENAGSGEASEDAFWALLERPVLLAWKVLLEEASAYLQQAWAEKVIAPTQGLAKMEQVDFLYGAQGKVREFVEQFAKPFLVDNESRLGQVLGEPIPLAPSFLKTVGDEKQLRPILEIVKKTPQRLKVEAKGESKIDGQTNLSEEKTEFLLECATPFKVNNRAKEGEATTTVLWSFDTCGDVVLTVSVSCDRSCAERAALVNISVPEASGLRLVKRYTGPEGFWRFLQDFSSGSHEFRGSDFTGSEPVWQKYHINMIRVFYRVEPPPTLTKLFSLLPSSTVPPSIIK